jgi:hypothetical protein
MGRGRQKAKDAKVARQLKYSGPGSDLKALERELIVGGSTVTAAVSSDTDDDTDDEYADRWDDETE